MECTCINGGVALSIQIFATELMLRTTHITVIHSINTVKNCLIVRNTDRWQHILSI